MTPTMSEVLPPSERVGASEHQQPDEQVQARGDLAVKVAEHVDCPVDSAPHLLLGRSIQAPAVGQGVARHESAQHRLMAVIDTEVQPQTRLGVEVERHRLYAVQRREEVAALRCHAARGR